MALPLRFLQLTHPWGVGHASHGGSERPAGCQVFFLKLSPMASMSIRTELWL